MTSLLPTDYQNYIHQSRYARWDDSLNRRETWPETVQRYIDFFQARTTIDLAEVRDAILNLEVMPSMRAMMTAGLALELDNVAGYNCAYNPIDHPHSFDEQMYILMCGTGDGFSVERRYTSLLPSTEKRLWKTPTTIVVEDSKIGWATAFRELLALLWNGKLPKWDLSEIRPKGARLKTFGGRASGPEPLNELFEWTVELFGRAKQRPLTSIECHDLACKIADVVVVGGVRRSALISLGDLDDPLHREAKSGAWWTENGQRALANNSAVYTSKPTVTQFLDEWKALIQSQSGERGIFNRQASQIVAARNGRRDANWDFGTNPCSEIILRPQQFCNLSEVVLRADDTIQTVTRKIRLATLLGTLQSTLTNFRYLRPVWQKNCEEERLLGVSMTGIMDCPMMWETKPSELSAILSGLRGGAVDANREYAHALGVNPATAITCVKPSGTVSQLVNSASGIHPRYDDHYIRTVRSDNKDPLAQMLRNQGVPCEPDLTKPDSTLVFSWPIASPANACTRQDLSAIQQLKLWLTYARHWCEHKPSISVYVKDDEWLGVGDFVYRHFDEMSGVSFFPYSDHVYKQAPYQPITPEQYNQALTKLPKVDWSQLSNYEHEDSTVGTRDLACSAGVCEL